MDLSIVYKLTATLKFINCHSSMTYNIKKTLLYRASHKIDIFISAYLLFLYAFELFKSV